jgi:endonuclease/exonuclease/phosphatase (EEP) superfamily protein YafD
MLYKEAHIFVIGSYMILLFAFLWPPDFRDQSPIYVWTAWVAFMIRTFVFPFGLALCVTAVVAAWARVWKMFATVLPLVAFTMGPTCWDFRPRFTPAAEGEPLVVMSVNLLMVNRDTRPIVEEIQTARPDVLLLQEYTNHWHDALQSSIGHDYPHVSFERRQDSFGTAIYSKRSFEEPVETHLPLGHAIVPQIRAVIHIADQPVALYNIHLLPPWGLEYTIEHRIQFADLVELLGSEPYPVVLGGDFNFTERSPQASARKRKRLRDAHSVGGWGRGATWPANSFFRWIPGLRLDHLYIGDGMNCVSCRTGVGLGSDHRPIVAEIGKGRPASSR